MNWQGLAIILGAGLAAYFALAVAYVGYVLTHPPRRGFAAAVSRGWPTSPAELPAEAGGPRRFSEWTFAARGRELPVWDVAGDDPGGPTVIVTPGWGGSRLGGLARLDSIAAVSSRVVLWDLPAHGDAPPGGICRLGTAETDDLLRLIDAVAGKNGSVVLAGFSLGAGMSIAAAARDERASGVIAEAPYRCPQTPARNVTRARGLPYRFNVPTALFLLGLCFGQGLGFMRRGGGFDRAVWAGRLRVPLRVIQGDADEVCPIEDGREIASAAKDGSVIVIPGGGHTDLWTRPDIAPLTREAVRRALREVSGMRP